MSLIGEVMEFALELALNSVNSWRMVVSLAVTGFVVWLILAHGPQNTVGTVLAVGVGIAGVVIGWRWSRAAEAV